MTVSELAGKPAPPSLLENIPRLVTAYYTRKPDPSDPAQRVSFGTSGHRGSSVKNSFNEAHILAITQAICEHRKTRNIDGPLFMGIDTHALSEPAMATAIEVFAGNSVTVMIQEGGGYTPTPVISHAILTHNRGRKRGLADGVVITPSHNPPSDGGFKYNPPQGGPADKNTTRLIQDRANEILARGFGEVRRIPYERAISRETTLKYDYVTPYVKDLSNIVDMEAIAQSGLKAGVDPLGGAGICFWGPVKEQYGIHMEVVNQTVDPTFGFMTVDRDGRIRMDCSSPYAMRNLIALREKFDVAFGNDPDADRHGIITRGAGLLAPNHYLSLTAWYLFQNRPRWKGETAIGKTLVSSSMIDRVAASLGRNIYETPVGFKWFVEGLLGGSLGFGCEESAGASFLRMDGSVWTTDKDGIIMNLLALEITARTGRHPDEIYADLEERFGRSCYRRIDTPASPEEKSALEKLSPHMVTEKELAGEKIKARITNAPGNNAPIGGLKVVSENAWFAARPSGTENINKIYAESFRGEDHLEKVLEEARAIVSAALRS
ncbi:MAG: alpha-D-glucose phosphate-specific phosphoglucomutase [Deltaproteobacteria bacterium]|nr:alpha-D-glucose phosphate-specific phosphoglucomutase [Deltaproteobacteria bacterium]MBW2048314.1 alpha-D-glucose phosphate-specific phosphoglucomutase [Deltaproteobacteria bacterium]MBW2110351.1 alpha-D-glucose phosphate-specific phosphoglucomutase [Deltaproteobacteria bacterium]MBW2353042.1 alpha-D-glucose phosphate-specific phosphoglucomutase [Deltaproteobacteria bacterium]